MAAAVIGTTPAVLLATDCRPIQLQQPWWWWSLVIEMTKHEPAIDGNILYGTAHSRVACNFLKQRRRQVTLQGRW